MKNRWQPLIAVDPGKTTGLAYGVFDMKADSAREAWETVSDLKAMELKGPYQIQAQYVVKLFSDLGTVRRVRRVSLPILIIEDFILRPGSAVADRDQLAPVRVMSAIEGALFNSVYGNQEIEPAVIAGEDISYDSYIVYQSPSDAKGYMTQERMKSFGIWQVGSAHCRDAVRHLALWMQKNLR